MPTAHFVHLTDRAVIHVTGADAETLLDGLVTASFARLAKTGALHTGLLSPQGKILFDFLLFRAAGGSYIDVDTASAEALVRRLTFYRLRAAVTFANVSDSFAAGALWPATVTPPGGIIAAPDPRHPDLGLRLILAKERLREIAAEPATEAEYHTHRISLGIPAAGFDYPLADTFPHEALYDQLGSVDFKKGCFVGQEVVSRMQHRGTARRRAIRITADGPLVEGHDVTAGAATIGTIGSVSGAPTGMAGAAGSTSTAIAMLRLDRAAEAIARGDELRAGDTRITLAPPDWVTFDIASGKPAEQP